MFAYSAIFDKKCPLNSFTSIHLIMAAGMFDGVRELRSRLPDVPDTIIAHFLAKVLSRLLKV